MVDSLLRGSRPQLVAPEPAIPAHRAREWLMLAEVLELVEVPCSAAPEEWWQPARADEARAACGSCLARVECLAYAVAARERWGVWGGLGPAERRALSLQVAS